MSDDKNTIYIVDDDQEICDSLGWLFESVNLNVQTFSSAEQFLEVFNPNLKGCLIIDVRMPYVSGLELLDSLSALNNKLPVIVMSGHGDIPIAIRAIKAGAIDFVLKPIHDQNLLEVVYACLKQNQETQIQTSVSSAMLTPREQEVMSLIVEGKYNKEIASVLNISVSTVEAHRARIMDKFNVRNLAQLIKAYYQIA